jgi:2-dehydro-3-deoxygluconokinase
MIDAVTIGETMVLLDPIENGPLDMVSGYRQRVAGAESNFAIALARLGFRTAWISRLGTDPFGRLIRRAISSEGVEVHAGEAPDAPTGIYFKERAGPDAVAVHYYRNGSAASGLKPGDVPEDVIQGSRLLHFTGISMAVTGTLGEATLHAVDVARKAGLEISFDPNLRPQLWSADSARRALDSVMRDLDVLFTGEAEAQLLTGQTEQRRVLAELRKRAIKLVVIKRAAAGALLASDDHVIQIPPVQIESVIDSVGAGDAFNAGFVAGHLKGLDLAECGKLGCAVGASALAGTGDYETVPAWAQARQLAASLVAHEMEPMV